MKKFAHFCKIKYKIDNNKIVVSLNALAKFFNNFK